jgi:hypothetical protein
MRPGALPVGFAQPTAVAKSQNVVAFYVAWETKTHADAKSNRPAITFVNKPTDPS